MVRGSEEHACCACCGHAGLKQLCTCSPALSGLHCTAWLHPPLHSASETAMPACAPSTPAVILLSNGKVCFHGPRELVLPFFEGQGESRCAVDTWVPCCLHCQGRVQEAGMHPPSQQRRQEAGKGVQLSD